MPLYPPTSERRSGRLHAVLGDVAATAALTTTALAQRLRGFVDTAVPGNSVRWIAIDAGAPAMEGHFDPPGIEPDQIAFIQYTSGSTGDPKGVVLTHRNLVSNSEAIRLAAATGRDSVVVSWLPPYHDMGLIAAILNPLYVGFHGVLMSPAAFVQKPVRWLRAISRYRGSHCGGPNFAYDLCVSGVTEAEREGLDLRSWRVAFNGAEPVRADTIARFTAAFAGCGLPATALFPCYGLAEATLLVAAGTAGAAPVRLAVDPEALAAHQAHPAPGSPLVLVSSGRPPLGEQIVVADPETLAPCAPGRIGEILVSGPGLAQGYWGRPELSRQVFEGRLPGRGDARFLRTGDLGFLHEGELFVTGRVKDLIIVRGRNIYPQDVEQVCARAHAALRAHGAAAFALETAEGESLGLIQELEYRRTPNPDEVLGAVREAIADAFEVPPTAVVLIPPGALPRTSSGKVQRSRARRLWLEGSLPVVAQWRSTASAAAGDGTPLPTGASPPAAAAGPGAAPGREGLRAYLSAALAEILRTSPERIDERRSLLAQGLDSLSAVQLSGRLQDDLGVDLPFADLLREITPAGLARELLARAGGPGQRPAGSALAGAEVQELPLSENQRALWFIHRLAPESTAYNLVFAARVAGALDVAAFQRAVQALVERQPSLRTSFHVRDGEPLQRIHPYLAAAVECVDVRGWDEARIDAVIAAEVHRPFDLGRAPLLRLRVLDRGAREAWLQVVMHHIIVDFWSFVVMVHDLDALYRAETGAEGAAARALPALPATYADHVHRQQTPRPGDSADAVYWRERLAGDLPLTELPVDRPRPPVQTYAGASLARVLDASLTRALKTVARERGATLYTLLLSVFQVLVHRLGGQRELVIGTPTAGRERPELADVVGYFVNSIPLRARIDPQAPFEAHLVATQAAVLDDLAHSRYPFAAMVADRLSTRDPSRHPLFQLMFVLQKAHRLDEAGLTPFVLGERGAHLALGDLRLESHPIAQRVAPFDLLLMMAESEGRLLASFQYNTDLFEAASVARIADCYERLLVQVAAAPGVRIADLRLLDAAQRRALLYAMNDTATEQPDTPWIPALFTAQASARPAAVAAEHAGERVTYLELERRANRLAHCLRRAGCGPESVVGILAERSIPMLVATLAVLKAGGAYLPLATGFPRERLAGMLTDSGARILLAGRGQARVANALQWEVADLATLVYLDADDPHALIEQADDQGDRRLWDYVAERSRDAIDASGWMNSYTGDWFTAAEMAEYTANVVAKLAPHLTPETRILEVGCGSGLTMFALAPRVARYHGTDLSPAIIEKDRAEAARRGHGNITLEALPADQVSRVAGGPFDIVILNSVVQLFPGHNYLRRVLRDCIARLDGDGLIFVGDVMDLRRRPALLQSLADFAQAHPEAGRRTKTDWDRELFLDADFCRDLRADLPGVADVEISDKLGDIDNELRAFRYDCLLRVERGCAPRPVARRRHQLGTRDWRDADGVQAPRVAGLPEHCAYVMYTSGSTGRPKGIAVPHRAVVRLAVSTNYAPLAAGGRIAHLSNPAFDAATYEIWGALLNGGRLVILDNSEVLDTRALVAHLQSGRIDGLFLTAALFRHVAGERPDAFSRLRYLLVGGDAVDPGAARAVLAAGPPGTLVNGYGPTEGTTFSSWHPIAAVPADAQRVPIGRPLANTQLYVLDERLEPVPPGIPGELYIGGLGIARGYCGRPGLTARQFVPDPFGAAAGGRLYRTGDRVRLNRDGDLEFLARVDQQVKIRGFRIEPSEVEAALSSCPLVREAAVCVHRDGDGDARLVAYVVPADDGCDSGALRTFLSRRLPESMLPAPFVLLESMPLNRNGKIDRAALPGPDGGRAGGSEAPRGSTERALADIWSELLGVAAIARDAHFFEFGGHSLLATQVISRVRDRLHVEVPLRLLFEHPVLAGFAAHLDALATAAGQAPAPQIRPAPAHAAPVVSFAQRRLWFLDQLQPGAAFYNVPGALALSGRLDASALRAALDALVARHATLRSRFPDDAGRPRLVIAGEAAMPFALIDLRLLDSAAAGRLVQRLAAAEGGRPFDLAAGPPVRAALLRMAGDEAVLLLTMHHIVSDGWSLAVLLRELAALYAAFAAGQPSPLPPLPLQYHDFAYWQRAWLDGGAREQQLAYWRGRLSGARDVLDLPTDRPRPAVQRYRGAQLALALPKGLAAGLRELALRRGATLFMALLAGFVALLHRVSGQTDISVGTPIANRNHAALEDLIGFFVNTLVLRTELDPAGSFLDLLERTRETTLGAYAHQDLPFEQLVDDLRPVRDLSRSPLFQVLFVLQNTPARVLQLPGLRVREIGLASDTAKFDLTLALEDDGEAISGYLEYATDLFDPATMARWRDQLLTLLAAAVADPHRCVAALPLIGPQERERLLRDWNAAAVPRPGALIHDPIAARAAEDPARVALVAEGRTMTRGELDSRANRLARFLAAAGVGPEVIVGVHLPRGLDLPLALLGVLKAGGAYLPLEPGLPPERLRLMLADSGARLVLTHDDLAPGLGAWEGDLVRLDRDWPRIACHPDTAPGVAVSPEHLAYVIYTSGSTGRPKGAMLAHRGVVNRLWWQAEAYGLGPEDCFLQKTPYGFDVSVWELFLPLMLGARLVLARPGGHGDPAYLAHLMAGEGVSIVHFVPSMLGAFLRERTDADLRALRRVICSGEALPAALVEDFHQRMDAALENLYGPTEASIDVTAWSCRPGDPGGGVPIGRPIANCPVYVLDGRLAPVPVGVAGELYLGGTALARGYLARPALSAERFVPDPFGAAPGGRLYRTGDLARWRADGQIEYLGRTDHQIKLRGLRIEPGEIEAELLRHEAVREAVVVARGDTPDRRRLHAFVTASGQAPSAQTLREHLGARLPEYMIPASFTVLDRLPLSANGKLDRNALPDSRPDAPAAAVAPRTPTEQRLADLWCELLELPRVGVTDNFFHLGGHSLLATRLAARVRDELAVELPLIEVFGHATIAELARLIEGRRGSGSSPAPGIQRVSREGRQARVTRDGTILRPAPADGGPAEESS